MYIPNQDDTAGSRLPSSPTLIFLGIIITLLLTFPGFLTWDSVNQLTEARLGTYSSLHPPVMAFLWRQVELIITGPFGMLLIQVIAIWTGLYFVQKYYLDCSCRIRTLMPMLVVFFPPIFGIVGLITKDIQMVAWLVLATGLTAKIIHHKVTIGKIPLISFISFWVVLWLALAQRHNAVGAAPGLIWFLLFSLFFLGKNIHQRLLVTFGISLVASITLFMLSLTANNLLSSIERHPWVQIAAFDIVGTAAFAKDPDFVERVQLSSLESMFRNPPVKTEELVASYHPYEWTFIFHDGPFVNFWGNWPNETEAKAFADAWLRTVRAYPFAYLSHRFAVFIEALGLGAHPAPGVGFTDWRTFAGKERAEALHIETSLSPLQSFVRLILRGFEEFTPLFKPYLYAIISIICLIAGAYLLMHGGPSLPFFLALSGIGAEMTVFLAAPTHEYRYSYWMIVSSVLSVILLVVYVTEQRKKITPESVTEPPA